MVVGYYGIVTKELRRLGFRYVTNAKGSHEKWVNDQGVTMIVPRNLNISAHCERHPEGSR